MKRHLHIDGTDQYGCFSGYDPRLQKKEPLTRPWAVFDEDEQQNVSGPYPFRWMAVLARAIIIAASAPP